jgi:alkylated DNA nucleotide flippase Atl1
MDKEAFGERNIAMIPREEAGTLINKGFTLVGACPKGRGTTSGWIAKAVGNQQGERPVGRIMSEQTSSGTLSQFGP